MLTRIRAWLRDEHVPRCHHCQRPIRNGNTISHATTYTYPTGGTRTTTRTWHGDKPACEAVAWAYADTAEEATP